MRDQRQILPSLLCAVLAALVPLAAAEAGARLIGRRIATHSYASRNNPLVDRYWRHYTAPDARSGERRIIVITNSQGHLGEADPSLNYPAQLERLLNRQDSPHVYRVANWALPGANAAEMVILAARAADHRPAAVVLVTFSNNFAREHTAHPLAFARNDVEQLAYLPQVRGRLSPWFLRRFEASRPRGWLAAHVALVHLHDSLVFWLRDNRNRGERLFQAMRERPSIPAEPVTDVGVQLMREIRDVLQRGLPDTPVIVVSMPLSREKVKPETWKHADDFMVKGREVFHGEQFTILDAKQAVDSSLFYSATHIRPEGHALFAEWLLPHVLRAVNAGNGESP